MPVERLYYDDCYLTEFSATVTAVDADGAVELDRTAFYPESGGQAHDLGALNGFSVERVTEVDDRILHHIAAPRNAFAPGEAVRGVVDWERRFDLMQHHTGQHLLSAVAEELCGWRTESVHISTESATIELAVAEIDPASLARLELEANRRIQGNLPVRIATLASAGGIRLRKPTGRSGPLRVVSIAELDHSACGGTHVRATGEIGALLCGHLEKIRKNTRLEFACGLRAVSLARRQSQWLHEASAVFQSSPDRIAPLAAAQRNELATLSKRFRTLESEAAQRAGADARRESGSTDAILCAVRRVPEGIEGAERAFAQGYCDLRTASPNRSILLTLAENTGAFLLCASADAGFDAKVWLSETGVRFGLKGGGTPAMVSGRIGDRAALPALLATLPSTSIEISLQAGL